MVYCDRVWLNKKDSPSTGSVVAFDGIVHAEDGDYRSTFLQVSDCYSKIRLHKSDYDSREDFINKMILLKDTISKFINHLQNETY